MIPEEPAPRKFAVLIFGDVTVSRTVNDGKPSVAITAEINGLDVTSVLSFATAADADAAFATFTAQRAVSILCTTIDMAAGAEITDADDDDDDDDE